MSLPVKEAANAWEATLSMPSSQRIPAQKKLYSQGIPNPKVTCDKLLNKLTTMNANY